MSISPTKVLIAAFLYFKFVLLFFVEKKSTHKVGEIDYCQLVQNEKVQALGTWQKKCLCVLPTFAMKNLST